MKRCKLNKVNILPLIGGIPLLAALMILWFVFQFQNTIVVFLLGICILLPVLGVLLVIPMAKTLEVQIAFPKQNVTRLDETCLSVQIKNHQWFPMPSLKIVLNISNRFYPNEDMHTLDLPAVAPFGKYEHRFAFSPVHCGSVEAVLCHVLVSDWFGLTTWECAIDRNQLAELLVYPPLTQNEIISVDESAGGSNEEVETREEKGYVSSEVLDIRKYIPGDRLQAIHWKLSAKAGELMVKEYESMSADHFQLLPEFSTENALYMDEMLEVLYNIGMMILRERGLGFSVYYWCEAMQKMVSNPVREEAQLLTVFGDVYHSAIPRQQIAGEALAHFRTYGAGRSGFVMYMAAGAVQVPEGEELGCYKEHIHIYEIMS